LPGVGSLVASKDDGKHDSYDDGEADDGGTVQHSKSLKPKQTQ
jgi:hypothetical protein